MSDLTFREKSKLENLFGMSSGYVLDFSNRTFREFVTDSVRRDIYSRRYDHASCSKANLLRRFWEVEPNHVVGKLLNDLVELAKQNGETRAEPSLIQDCQQIADRLRQGAPLDEWDVLGDELTEKDLDLLARSLRNVIDANEPEAGLDRLHTFVTKFLRLLCGKKGIAVTRDKPLHSLLGEYIRSMTAQGAIETKMTERILKSSIANLEAFNSVRKPLQFRAR